MTQTGPSELQDGLNKKYTMDIIPYDKVVGGIMRALDIVCGKWNDSYDLLSTY
jgi:hypothetical protein